MDSTTLPIPTTGALEEEQLAMTSLYQALQELPDARRAVAQTLFARTAFDRSGEIGRTNEFKGSGRVGASSQNHFDPAVRLTPPTFALPRHLLHRLSPS